MLHREKRFGKWAALLLCLALLAVGPGRPMVGFAEIDDDELDENVDEIDEAEDSAGEQAASTTSTSSGNGQYQSELDNVNQKLESLEEQKKKLESSIENAQSEKEKLQLQQNYLDQQISNTKDTIALLEERIELLEQDIEEKEEGIRQKQVEIDESYELLRKRLRAMYMQDDGTLLGLLLGADSFSDFLTRTENVVRVADHDRALMQHMTEERIAIEEAKQDLEDQKQKQEDDKTYAESMRQDLSSQYSAAAAQMQDIEEMERQFMADLEKNQAMYKQMQAELAEIYRKIEWSKNPYVGGEMLWPLPGFYQISSYYGSRFGGSDFHTGVDITGSGCYGNTIVAANDGTVKLTNWTYTNGVGYGIYLIIDHGGGVSTVYAHCSNILVSVGQEVRKGDAIAEVGSTGWSTGPHLHFEVRNDGNYTDPMPYLSA